MADTFKPGDVVQLKSDGREMTVTRIEGGRATCGWFLDNMPLAKSFYMSALVKVEKPGPKIW
jgi:uncharacterized protein YodC (DUF2158 family)